jgi:putative glutamine amidotransferase
MRKIYVAGGSDRYANWMEPSFVVKKVAESSLVVFTGGTDINPRLYGERPHSHTEQPDDKRDTEEKEIFEKALSMDLPMVGICRGAQFLCAMAGGRLVPAPIPPS